MSIECICLGRYIFQGDEPDVPWSEKWLRLKETLIYFKSNILTGIAYYLIFITRLGFSLATVSISTYYKAFALTFIGKS